MSQDSQTVRAACITARYLVPAVLVGGGLGAIFNASPFQVFCRWGSSRSLLVIVVLLPLAQLPFFSNCLNVVRHMLERFLAMALA